MIEGRKRRPSFRGSTYFVKTAQTSVLAEYLPEEGLYGTRFTNTGGADKSLSGPGRKQANSGQTLTFASHSKKKSEGCPSNQVSAAGMTSTSDEKWRPFNCFFSRVGLRTYQHHCNIPLT